MTDQQSGLPDKAPLRLEQHARYPVSVYTWCDSVEIDISGDNGGWSGCGHPGEINLTRDDMTRLLAALDAAQAKEQADREAWEREH